MTKNIRAIILAAGKSTRFNRDKSKLLHTICGQEMILYPIKLLQSLEIPVTLILGHQADDIKNLFIEKMSDSWGKDINHVIQQEQKGTGHAVMCSKEHWDKENILILCGDTPLLSEDLILELIEKHNKENATLSFLTTRVINPKGYGRVIKENNKIKIVEEKNCNQEEALVDIINTGIYLINKDFLQTSINQLEKNSVTGEIYFTDIVQLASDQNLKVQTIPTPFDEVRGINSLQELWAAEQIKRSEIMKNYMQNGVQFELAQSTHLDVDISIGKNSFIGAGAIIIKGSKIGENCTINAFSIVENTIVGNNTIIRSHSVVQDSKIGQNVSVGPFARLRDNVILEDNAVIGNFVEVKKSKIGKNSKAKHLTYLGDCQMGDSVNIGGGTVTCNYDGQKKHTTTIQDNSFIGGNNTLIAPVTVGKNSYTAAGSTITKNVPENSLAIARSRQENKEKKTLSEEKINFIGAIKAKNNQTTL